MPKSENIVDDDIATDILVCSTPKSTLEPDPYYFDPLVHNSRPYHHPHCRRNGNHTLRYL
jgi:hypothetical protein